MLRKPSLRTRVSLRARGPPAGRLSRAAGRQGRRVLAATRRSRTRSTCSSATSTASSCARSSRRSIDEVAEARSRAGHQRAHRRLPPLPGARGPAHHQGAQGTAGGPDAWRRSATATTCSTRCMIGVRSHGHAPARRRARRASSRCRRAVDTAQRLAGATGLDHRGRPRPARGPSRARTSSSPTRGRRWARRTSTAERVAGLRAVPGHRRAHGRGRRPTASSCTACPRIAARRSPTRSSTAAARSSSTRPRTGCTRRRRCCRCRDGGVSMRKRQERQEAIRRIVRREHVRTQRDLVEHLRALGYSVHAGHGQPRHHRARPAEAARGLLRALRGPASAAHGGRPRARRSSRRTGS